jgi:hypothetical protein
MSSKEAPPSAWMQTSNPRWDAACGSLNSCRILWCYWGLDCEAVHSPSASMKTRSSKGTCRSIVYSFAMSSKWASPLAYIWYVASWLEEHYILTNLSPRNSNISKPTLTTQGIKDNYQIPSNQLHTSANWIDKNNHPLPGYAAHQTATIT